MHNVFVSLWVVGWKSDSDTISSFRCFLSISYCSWWIPKEVYAHIPIGLGNTKQLEVPCLRSRAQTARSWCVMRRVFFGHCPILRNCTFIFFVSLGSTCFNKNPVVFSTSNSTTSIHINPRCPDFCVLRTSTSFVGRQATGRLELPFNPVGNGQLFAVPGRVVKGVGRKLSFFNITMDIGYDTCGFGIFWDVMLYSSDMI